MPPPKAKMVWVKPSGWLLDWFVPFSPKPIEVKRGIAQIYPRMRLPVWFSKYVQNPCQLFDACCLRAAVGSIAVMMVYEWETRTRVSVPSIPLRWLLYGVEPDSDVFKGLGPHDASFLDGCGGIVRQQFGPLRGSWQELSSQFEDELNAMEAQLNAVGGGAGFPTGEGGFFQQNTDGDWYYAPPP